MLESYGSREGVLQALSVLAASPLSPELREQVIEDTLRGAAAAKRAWTESSMVEDVSAGLDAVTIPVAVVVGDRDQVEHEAALREIFSRFLPRDVPRTERGGSPFSARGTRHRRRGVHRLAPSRLTQPADFYADHPTALSQSDIMLAYAGTGAGRITGTGLNVIAIRKAPRPMIQEPIYSQA